MPEDKRSCVFCQVIGDGPTDGPGRYDIIHIYRFCILMEPNSILGSMRKIFQAGYNHIYFSKAFGKQTYMEPFYVYLICV